MMSTATSISLSSGDGDTTSMAWEVGRPHRRGRGLAHGERVLQPTSINQQVGYTCSRRLDAQGSGGEGRLAG